MGMDGDGRLTFSTLNLENAHVVNTYLSPCCISISRNDHDPCQYYSCGMSLDFTVSNTIVVYTSHRNGFCP